MLISSINVDKCAELNCKYLSGCGTPHCDLVYPARMDLMMQQIAISGNWGQDVEQEYNLEIECPYELEQIVLCKEDLTDWESVKAELIEELKL